LGRGGKVKFRRISKYSPFGEKGGKILGGGLSALESCGLGEGTASVAQMVSCGGLCHEESGREGGPGCGRGVGIGYKVCSEAASELH